MKKKSLIAIGLLVIVAIVIPLILIGQTNSTKNKNIETHMKLAESFLKADPVKAFQEYDIAIGYLSPNENKPGNNTFETATIGEGKCLLELQNKLGTVPDPLSNSEFITVGQLTQISISNSNRGPEAANLIQQLHINY